MFWLPLCFFLAANKHTTNVSSKQQLDSRNISANFVMWFVCAMPEKWFEFIEAEHILSMEEDEKRIATLLARKPFEIASYNLLYIVWLHCSAELTSTRNHHIARILPYRFPIDERFPIGSTCRKMYTHNENVVGTLIRSVCVPYTKHSGEAEGLLLHKRVYVGSVPMTAFVSTIEYTFLGWKINARLLAFTDSVAKSVLNHRYHIRTQWDSGNRVSELSVQRFIILFKLWTCQRFVFVRFFVSKLFWLSFGSVVCVRILCIHFQLNWPFLLEAKTERAPFNWGSFLVRRWKSVVGGTMQ